MSNAKKQGNVGIGLAIGWFTSKGHNVAIPLTDSQDYDLIVEMEDKLYKVQVKTTYCKTKYNSYQLNLAVRGGSSGKSTTNKKFDNKKVDILFAVTEEGKMYLIPCNEVEATMTICLSDKYDKYLVTL